MCFLMSRLKFETLVINVTVPTPGWVNVYNAAMEKQHPVLPPKAKIATSKQQSIAFFPI